MFDQSRIDEKLAGFAKEFGWMPEPHSISDVDAWTKRLSTAFEIEPKGNILQIRDLTKSERHFIANERAYCMASCYYFLTRYYWIKTKNSIVRFAFRHGQWILWLMLCELDRMGVSKMLQILKARQLGVTTLAEGMATWASLFIPGVAAQIGSADGQKTQIMLGMMLLAIDQLPPWLPPTQTRSKTASDRALLEFSRIGSLIMVQPGSIRGGMGQGATPTFVHLSEVSQYTNPVTQLDEGLFKALHEGPELVVLLESTGDAQHQSAWWWKEMWIANRDNYHTGGAKFLPVFLPATVETDMYPDVHWLKKFPIPDGWTPNDETRSQIIRGEAYIRNAPMLSKVLGDNWTMSREKQWYLEFNYEDHKRRRVEKSWRRQMPLDDYDALLGENDKVYGESTVEIVSASVQPLSQTGVYMLVGDDIPERREPPVERVWYGEDAPARLKTHWITRKETKLEWMFVPLKPEPEHTFDPLEKFLIFEEPRDGYDYSVGMDTGTGVGGDRTVLNVTRYATDDEPDVQVAEFASDSIPAAEIYVYIAALASLYSRYLVQRPTPKLCIEMKRKFGDLPYHMVRQLGMRRWHEWGHGFDRKTFKSRVGKEGRVGWFTNEWSRPLLLSAYQYALDGGWYVVRSKWLAQELCNLEQKVMPSGKTRVDHESGGHDDRVFAGAQAYWTLHQNDCMMERAKKRYEEPDDGDILVETGHAAMTVEIPGGRWWQRQHERAGLV